ncbi:MULTISPECIES: hypothetical protein [Enterobacteriaceae]|uniref:Uncharacterized protein n=2 Tax=Citrobacter pasteurii TaxID=1563222 RepID=A0ABX8K0B9_9ENTR|nr:MULTISPECIES: hypothetical protein [Enterobacteriaceae]EBH9598191.1 hypothetical protein [Salmonella enterica subsp. enterica serovar Havana]ECY8733961.1 hypothetical protein [Salmonella enterica subsp. enterica serovar Schwarzengrund]EEW1532002.1 hypothetical protein [Escherichia coli]ELE8172374.1 hypothetical protein [Salmonella enterica]HBZ7758811.1 hypothetical protein [Klebsiella pneumoniae]
MSHPVGKHISKEQEHELNYWLKKRGFKESKENRTSLVWLIESAKLGLGMPSNEHLEHAELDKYFEDNKGLWIDEFETK